MTRHFLFPFLLIFLSLKKNFGSVLHDLYLILNFMKTEEKESNSSFIFVRKCQQMYHKNWTRASRKDSPFNNSGEPSFLSLRLSPISLNSCKVFTKNSTHKLISELIRDLVSSSTNLQGNSS